MDRINTAKTIQIFLPDGSPRSIRIAEFTSRVMKIISFPRNKMDVVGNRPEVNDVGVYFLFGESEVSGRPLVYVGEAEDCYHRIKQHNKAKDFWNTCAIVTSKTNSLTKSHIKFLEWFCYTQAKEIGRYELENSTIPTKSYITESMEADLLDDFESIKILLATLGFPVFEDITRVKQKELLFCKGKDALATGEYTDEGFVVFKGSTANFNESSSASGASKSLRKRLLDAGVLVQKGNVYVFDQDHIFSSPSSAADVVLARSSNGWIEWKRDDGKTLHQLIRE
ncbi:GIY-YIG nuclease family protein [Brevibacillus fortis]|uniref:DUF4357 domain-containing protein n=1 Tax=Brevibacillus fortis TaxID=2126352 RepID=A0A2P7UJR4_9BACL|nr:GIY-YIG nuclease family protein [Brevibacillus fortis]PSJ87252.1 DUF4357 domain-containing protein [Brevibacillus fortis]